MYINYNSLYNYVHNYIYIIICIYYIYLNIAGRPLFFESNFWENLGVLRKFYFLILGKTVKYGKN